MKERNRRGQFRAIETHNYKKKMKDHFGTFTSESEEAFNEAALERYDFGSCKDGEKMTFGKCQKTGGSSKNAETKKRLESQKSQAEKNLAGAKKRGNKKQENMFMSQINSYNKKISSL